MQLHTPLKTNDQYLGQLADPETILSCSSDCLGLGFSAATSIPYLECSNDVPACCQHPQMALVQRVNNCLLLQFQETWIMLVTTLQCRC